MDNDIDSLLLRQFSSMATQDRDVLISEFRGLLGNHVNEPSCLFYLEMNNWLVSVRTNRINIVTYASTMVRKPVVTLILVRSSSPNLF